jgi:glycosyltransferase involved in cell wall biosynthesis
LRIAIVTPFYPPSIGGVETIAKDTAEELAKRGHDVSVITTTYDNRWVKITEQGVFFTNNVKVYRLNPSWLKIGYATIINGLKDKLVEIKPEIVHCHDLHPHLFQVIKWKDELNCKVVAQLHCPKATGIDHLPARLLFKPVVYYLKKVQDEIDAFIAHTDFEEDWLKEVGIEEVKIYKVRFPCVPKSLLEKYQECPSNDYILYVGRISWRKGIHTLLKAISLINLNKFKVVIAGPRDEKYFEKILRLTESLRLNDKVEFMDKVSEDKKYELMSGSAFFVSPSIKDYYPITLLEAQALGKPVISTNVGAIPEIVLNGETGILVDPYDVEGLAKAIKQLMINKEKRREMGENARKWIEDNFLLEKTIDGLEEVYTKISAC